MQRCNNEDNWKAAATALQQLNNNSTSTIVTKISNDSIDRWNCEEVTFKTVIDTITINNLPNRI